MAAKKKFLTGWMIALINVSAICNIKNFPLLAEYGLSIVTYLLLSALFFFIPIAFFAAELASAWPERGIYTWVKEALGPRFGFLAIWLQWVSNAIWYPTILTFIAGTLAYAIDPELATSKSFVFAVVLIAFWSFTLINFFGVKLSGWISSISALFGTIIPIALIICLGALWLFSGYPSQIAWSWRGIFPNLHAMNELVLLSGVLLGLAGLEMSAVHAENVRLPERDYPIGILASVLLILLFSILGSLSISAIVPLHEIELASGGMKAFSFLFQAFRVPWMTLLISIITVFGALGMMSSWIAGPSRGMLAAAEEGDLPPFFRRVNRHGVPIAILCSQGLIVTLLSTIFLFMPTVNSSYWALVALASILYQLMYLLLFISGILLRYKRPEVPRPYKIPFGTLGLWGIGLAGIFGSFFGFFFGFFPPAQFEVGKLLRFESFLIVGALIFCLLPFWIYRRNR